jgi:hypothetical protein
MILVVYLPLHHAKGASDGSDIAPGIGLRERRDIIV